MALKDTAEPSALISNVSLRQKAPPAMSTTLQVHKCTCRPVVANNVTINIHVQVSPVLQTNVNVLYADKSKLFLHDLVELSLSGD